MDANQPKVSHMRDGDEKRQSVLEFHKTRLIWLPNIQSNNPNIQSLLDSLISIICLFQMSHPQLQRIGLDRSLKHNTSASLN